MDRLVDGYHGHQPQKISSLDFPVNPISNLLIPSLSCCSGTGDFPGGETWEYRATRAKLSHAFHVRVLRVLKYLHLPPARFLLPILGRCALCHRNTAVVPQLPPKIVNALHDQEWRKVSYTELVIADMRHARNKGVVQITILWPTHTVCSPCN